MMTARSFTIIAKFWYSHFWKGSVVAPSPADIDAFMFFKMGFQLELGKFEMFETENGSLLMTRYMTTIRYEGQERDNFPYTVEAEDQAASFTP